MTTKAEVLEWLESIPDSEKISVFETDGDKRALLAKDEDGIWTSLVLDD